MSEKIKKMLSEMSDEEIVSELLCWEFRPDLGKRAVEKFIKENCVSNFYYHFSYTDEHGKWITDTVRKYSRTPVLVAADVEFGVPRSLVGHGTSPSFMALGAADDAESVYEIGRLSAKICRAHGINFTLSPVVDINFNFKNPVTNTRAVSDDPERVYKIASAYSKGMRSEGNFATCMKHFPGDGVDDRNQHLCTSVNSLSMDEWWKSYGSVYKRMIDDGVDAVMVGHISLPAYGMESDEVGFYPASISKRLICDLLKGELGFEGCVISDAMSMVGVASRVSAERLAVEFFLAGGDMLLFPERGDYQRVLAALKSGEIPKERILDAAYRCLKVKENIGLFDEGGEKVTVSIEDIEKYRKTSKKLAENSISLVRNLDGILPLNKKSVKSVLQINISYGKKNERTNTIPYLTAALEGRGCTVDFMTNPTHYRVDNMVDLYDAVIIACDIHPTKCSGSSLFTDWNNIMAFWRGYALRGRKVVFLSLGDPYKLYDLPFLRTYVNAYSPSDSSVNAAVKAIFGEIPFAGRSPVALPGFFERED